MENQENSKPAEASEPTKTVTTETEIIETPQVSINITKSDAGDLTVITLVAESSLNSKQLSMLLQALARNIMEQPPEEPQPVSGAV